MGFTVIRGGGTKDKPFEAYAQLLRQQGVDLGRLPRVLEPGTKRRWLYVWDTQAKAQTFADELKKRTGDSAWEVMAVNGRPSEGPLGPVVMRLARRGDRLIFVVDPLSRAMIRSAFPDAFGVDFISIYTETWDDFQKTRGTLADLVERIAPALTGLSGEQLEALGYIVIDELSEETWVFVPPEEAAES